MKCPAFRILSEYYTAPDVPAAVDVTMGCITARGSCGCGVDMRRRDITRDTTTHLLRSDTVHHVGE